MPTLADLNAARATNGKAPLKAWKESKAQLADAYAKERSMNPNFEKEPFEAPQEEIAAQQRKRDAGEKTVKPTRKAKKASAKHSPDSVAQYYAAHSINPKVARAKMRAAGYSAPYTLEQVQKVLGK